MDIKNLTTFVYVAEMNSFTKAAEALGYTQSTVSFQIKQLEKELDCTLFDRINHSVSLTKTGMELLSYAHKVRRLTEEVKEGIQSAPESEGNVVMATASSLCTSMLGDNYVPFRQAHKNIRLKVTEAGTTQMLKMIDRNEADMILTLDSRIYNTDYIVAKEERVSVHFVVSAKSDMQDKMTLEEIVKYPFVLAEKGMSYTRLFEERLSEKSLEVKPVLETGNTEIICKIIQQGVGVGVLPDYVTREKVDKGLMKYIEVEGCEIEVWKQLLYHKNKWVSKQMRAVMEYCMEKEFEKIK